MRPAPHLTQPQPHTAHLSLTLLGAAGGRCAGDNRAFLRRDGDDDPPSARHKLHDTGAAQQLDNPLGCGVAERRAPPANARARALGARQADREEGIES